MQQTKKKIIQQMETQHQILDRKLKNREWIDANYKHFGLLKSVPENLLNEVCFSFPLLYTLIKRLDPKKILTLQTGDSYDLLTRQLKKEYLKEILEFFDANLGTIP